MSNKLATFYIVRHGETEWNVARIIQGQQESNLTKKGIEQAGEAAQKLKNIQFDVIFSSDLTRASRTAEIIKLERKLEILTKESLRERAFGHFEGRKGEDFHKEMQQLLGKYKLLPKNKQRKFKFYEGYENDEEVISRFITFLREAAVAYPGSTVLIVTHGGVIRTFLGHLGFAKMEELQAGTFKNAGYIKVKSDGTDFFLEEVEGYEKANKS
jgi:broad specificity phosphatase PhoE